MKTRNWQLLMALGTALVLSLPLAAQVIDLDTQPSFDFAHDPAADPLFAPEALGLRVWPVPDSPRPRPPAWHYQLLPGSEFVDDCLICGRPPLIVPMHGEFDLRLVEQNPLFSIYRVEALAFAADVPGGPDYKIEGTGSYMIGGEVGLIQDMLLKVTVDHGRTNKLCYFTNVTRQVTRPWPFIEINLAQTNGEPMQTFRMRLEAAPLREVWFSTQHGFTPGIGSWFTKHVSAGDLVSSRGRVVKRNADLTRRLGIMPAVPDLGLDAADVLLRGEVAFSIEEDVFSESLGPLHHGDVLSDRGRVVAPYTELIGAFSPQPPTRDEGLDALHIRPDGEIYFSVTNDFFSERLGQSIRRGDLLSSRGVVVKTHDALLARFHPPPIPHDWGLDAVFVWPNGEIWFSLEEGFRDDWLGSIDEGDLLSDQGYIVYRNRDLLAPFEPLEDLADFGLDALFVVSDAILPPADVPAPRNTGIRFDPDTGSLLLDWEATGRLFQLEQATNILGPWLPASPIRTEPPAAVPGALTNAPQGYYRLRQW